MNENGYGIFRAEAVRRHIESRDRAVLPRFVSPRIFLVLWLLLGLVTALGVTAWFARVPVYATGPVVALARGGPVPGQTTGVLFLPAQYRDTLHPGQTAFVQLAGGGEQAPRSIVAVGPDVLSPAEARGRFGLDSAAGDSISGPVVAALVSLEPFPSGLPATAYAGTVFGGKVRTGSRRLVALVPVIGRLMGG
jgi:hypothetical protein